MALKRRVVVGANSFVFQSVKKEATTLVNRDFLDETLVVEEVVVDAVGDGEDDGFELISGALNSARKLGC